MLTSGNGGKKTLPEFIKEGQEWYAKKLKEGWEETPMGILPMTEIKKAGFRYSNDGEWLIPIEELISDGNATLQPGEKYFGLSTQFTNWSIARRREESKERTEETINQLSFINKEEAKAVAVDERVSETDDDIIVSEVPF